MSDRITVPSTKRWADHSDAVLILRSLSEFVTVQVQCWRNCTFNYVNENLRLAERTGQDNNPGQLGRHTKRHSDRGALLGTLVYCVAMPLGHWQLNLSGPCLNALYQIPKHKAAAREEGISPYHHTLERRAVLYHMKYFGLQCKRTDRLKKIFTSPYRPDRLWGPPNLL
jgi:hypothetical protein